MRSLKYVLYAVGALIVLVVAGAVFVAATFHPNAYKPQIVQLVKDKTGRTLIIGGDIGLKLFPKIGASVAKVSLSEPGSSKEFAAIDTMQVYLAVLPLLRKEVVVDEIRLDGLRANLVRYKNGSTNFSDLGGAGNAGQVEGPKRERPAAGPGGQRPLRLDVSGIRITRSRVTWRDETTGNDVDLELNDLNTGRLANRVPSRIALDVAVRGRSPKLDLKGKLTGTLTLDPDQQRMSFKAVSAKLDGSALQFTDIDAQVKAELQADGAQRTAKVSDLSLDAKVSRGKDKLEIKLAAPSIESGPQSIVVDGLTLAGGGSVAGLTLSEANLKAPKLRVNLAANQIRVEGLVLLMKGKLGNDALDVDLNAPRLEVSPDSAAGEAAQLLAKLTGAERKADVLLKLSGVEGSARALKIAALTLDVDAKQKDSAVKAALRTPVTANLEAKLLELPRITGEVSLTDPSIRQKTVNLSLSGTVRADAGKERLGADLVAKLDQSTIKAKLGMSPFTAPAYDLDLDIDKLDVDSYLPPKQKATEAKPAKAPRKEPVPAGEAAQARQSEQPIDFSPLKALNLNAKLKIGGLVADNVKASDVRIEAKAKNGKLNADPIAANLYQGTVKGSLAVDADASRVAVKQNLTGVSIGPLLRDVMQKDILEGRGNVMLDVTTTGKLVSAMKKGLNGTAKIDLRDGAVNGIDLAQAMRSVKAKFGAKSAEGTGSKTEKTDFSELTASFTIRNGVAHNEDLSLKSPFLRVGGTGDINIGEDSVNYVVKASIVGTMAGQGGKELAQLKGLSVPVRVSGPYDALHYQVELSQMLSDKEQLEAAKEAARAAAKEALKGAKLQDLLGGPNQGQPKPGGDQSQPAAPAKKPEDQFREQLKGLLR